MTDRIKEQLSAFLDGELPEPESALLLKRLERDDELRGALSRMTIWRAIWLSCILFGLIHALNVLITGDLPAALIQAVAAFMSGVMFMALRIRTGSLYPVIIVHAVWDFSLFVGLSARAPAATACAWRYCASAWRIDWFASFACSAR